MSGRPGRFWGSAAATAVVVAALVAWAGPLVLRLEPRPGLRPITSGEFWLLTVFTLGMLALLLGVSVALGGWFRGSLLREGLEGRGRDASSADAASGEVPEEPDSEAAEEEEGFDPGWWTAAVGVHLLVIYWAGWWVFN